MLALLVHGALGRPAEEVLPFAAATELLHNGTLIHDDAEVRERLRRGREAVWARYGLDQAINCGDAMLFGALKCLESLEIAPRQARRLGALVTDHMLRIIRAEVGHPEPWSDAWIERARSRTGGLFALALAGSAMLAGVPEGALHTLEVVGGQLGVVFQAQDELLALSRSDSPGAVSVERAVEVIDSHRREVQRLASTIEEPALQDLLSALADVLLAPLVPPA
jgi:geranylgeranyl pyrophosphate synthase